MLPFPAWAGKGSFQQRIPPLPPLPARGKIPTGGAGRDRFFKDLAFMEPQAPFKSKILPYLLLAPSNIVIVVFLFYPALETFRLSLYRSDPFGFRKMYVGLDNFVSIFTSADYGSSLQVTFLFTLWVVVFGLVISLGLAVLVNQKVRGIRFYRTAMIWPYALSTAIAGAIWVFLFDPTSGILNYFFAAVFDFKPQWLTSGDLAFWVIVAATVWKNMGYNIVFFLAGLQNIPDELKEAASIDGASSWQIFWRITFIMLSPITFFLLIMNVIHAFFDTFGLIEVMTRGGPAGATNILIYNLYRDAFVNHKVGIASAESIILFTMVVFVTLIQFRTAGRRVHYQ